MMVVDSTTDIDKEGGELLGVVYSTKGSEEGVAVRCRLQHERKRRREEVGSADS